MYEFIHPKAMNRLLRYLRQGMSKPLLFAFFGACGGLGAALAGEAFLALALPPSIAPSLTKIPAVDIIFVLDVTSSMNEEINGVKSGIQQFAQAIAERELDAQVGLIAFGDRFEGEEPQILSFSGSPLTSDATSFQSEVGRLAPVGGGDTPESSLDALSLSAQQPFRPQATKVILLITDAPPHIPDRDSASLDAVANTLVAKGIDQLHLVVQEDDRSIYSSLQEKVPGEVFTLAETAAARQGFEAILPELGETIAQTTLKSLQTTENYSVEAEKQLLLVTALWTGLLAIGITLALLVGQNFYLRRKWLTGKSASQGAGGALLAGTLAGGIGQLIFSVLAGIPLLMFLGRIASWTILGSLLGGGISLVIPNLKTSKALQGGAIGGVLGSGAFLLATSLLTQGTGRLLGGLILGFFLGLMVALIELLTRQAYLLIHWPTQETTTLSLGKNPIILESANHAHIYLSPRQGYYPETAKIFQEGEQIVMSYNPEYGAAKGMKIFNHVLTDGTTRKIGDVKIEIKNLISPTNLS